MREYHFSAELAKRYGLDEAIMLHNLAYWVQKNTLDARNIHEGKVWTYNSQTSFTEWFPWWSRRQIQRILHSLEDQKAIIKGSFNAKPMDRTLWYAVCDTVLEHYGISAPPAGMETMDGPADETETVLSSEPNGATERTEPCSETHETVPAIPKYKHKEKTKETPSGVRVNQAAQFRTFWDAYPRKEGKKKALEKWKRLNPDPELFGRIMQGLYRALRSEQWRRGVIPHPTTWLNGERWEDELTPPTRRLSDREPGRIDPGEGCEYV